jgi:hypothetical protein
LKSTDTVRRGMHCKELERIARRLRLTGRCMRSSQANLYRCVLERISTGIRSPETSNMNAQVQESVLQKPTRLLCSDSITIPLRVHCSSLTGAAGSDVRTSCRSWISCLFISWVAEIPPKFCQLLIKFLLMRDDTAVLLSFHSILCFPTNTD